MPSCPTTEPFVLDKSNPVLALEVAVDGLFIHRYAAATPVPASLFTGANFVSITRTPGELSIVAPKGWPTENGMPPPGPEHSGGPWSGIKVKGPLEHSMVGVLNEIATTLKNASVSIFTLSTWDTDYILVTTDTLDKAKKALADDGWKWA